MKSFNIFISHSKDDKAEFVRPLAKALQNTGLDIWYDEFNLKIGDSLRKAIDYGLSKSNYGIVVISKSFMQKSWTNWELNGLLSREISGKEVILPIWHHVTHEQLLEYSPPLADKFALNSDMELSEIVKKIVERVKPDLTRSDINNGILMETIYQRSASYLAVKFDDIESILRNPANRNGLYFAIRPGETIHEWGSGGERETVFELSSASKKPMIILKHTDYWDTTSDDSMDYDLPSRIIIQASSDDQYGIIKDTVSELINLVNKCTL